MSLLMKVRTMDSSLTKNECIRVLRSGDDVDIYELCYRLSHGDIPDDVTQNASRQIYDLADYIRDLGSREGRNSKQRIAQKESASRKLLSIFERDR